MLFFLEFQVEYGPQMTQKDLLTIWTAEAKVALKAKEAGTIVDLWKCVGERRVLAIVEVDSPDTLDGILWKLPIMQRMGQYVQIKVTSLRRYADFAADIEEILSSN